MYILGCVVGKTPIFRHRFDIFIFLTFHMKWFCFGWTTSILLIKAIIFEFDKLFMSGKSYLFQILTQLRTQKLNTRLLVKLEHPSTVEYTCGFYM